MGEADARPSDEKKLAALSKGIGDPKVTVIVPLVNAAATCAEKIKVLTPDVPEPLVTSASLL